MPRCRNRARAAMRLLRRGCSGPGRTIGCLSFGGPAGQIALMHRIIVDEKKWLGEKQFLHALNFCMLLPGPEAMQLATYAGWRCMAGAAAWRPACCSCCPAPSSSWSFRCSMRAFGQVAVVAALFFGIKAAVLAIVVEALMRVARRALKLPIGLVDRRRRLSRTLCLRRPLPAGHRRWPGSSVTFRTGPSSRKAAAAPIDWRGTLADRHLLWLTIWLVPRRASPPAASVLIMSSRSRALLFQARDRHLWRRLCRPRLHGAGGGGGLWLAEARVKWSTAWALPKPRRDP